MLEEKNGVYHKKAEEVYRESIASQLMIASNVVPRRGWRLTAVRGRPPQSQLNRNSPC
jgi:hypothetical protein